MQNTKATRIEKKTNVVLSFVKNGNMWIEENWIK